MLQSTILVVVAISPALAAVFHRGETRRANIHLRHGRTTMLQRRSRLAWQNTRGDGPGSLAEYCAGGTAKLDEKTEVVANWKGYGTYYPGVVANTRNNGSYDVHYDDGWTEKRVDAEEVKPAEGAEAAQKAQPKDDAVCDLAEDVEDMKNKLKEANQNVAVYLASQRSGGQPAATGGAGGEAVAAGAAPSAAAPPGAAAPAPATMSDTDGAEANRLEELKAELEQINEEIANEEAMIAGNAEVLKSMTGKAVAGPSAPKTVDQLIAEYEIRIAERKQVLEDLRKQRRAQEQQMAAVGGHGVSLDDIVASVKELSDDMQAIKAKRDKLESEGRLDSELKAAIDAVLAHYKNMQDKIKALVEKRKKADERRKALQEAEAAAQLAAAKAKMTEKLSDAEAEKNKLALQAAEDARKAAEASAAQAERDVFEAGEAVEEDLAQVTKETEVLDKGVHPHGHKWWRYRYEHSFVESGMMILISLLMLFYVKLFNWIRYEVYEKSHMGSESGGTLYTRWLEFTSLQMLANLLCFLSIWFMDRFHCFDLLAIHFHSSESMRLPGYGSGYRHIAFDISIVLMMALLFYFMMIFSIVHCSIGKIQQWAVSDVEAASRSVREGGFVTALSESRRTTASKESTGEKKKRILSFGGNADEFFVRKAFFLMHMTAHPEVLQKLASQHDEKLTTTELLAKFPFWKYLRWNVRAATDSLLELNTPLWIGVITTFVVLMFLHHFAHMGYIRVLGFFLFLQFVVIGLTFGMIYKVNKVVERELETQEEEDDDMFTPGRLARLAGDVSGGMVQASLAKTVVLFLLQYTLFFLCYGAARFVCQLWMWRLHFWLALGTTLVTAVLTVIYITAIAPVMPSFAVSMAMPPYIDSKNVKTMETVIETLKTDRMDSSDFVNVGK